MMRLMQILGAVVWVLSGAVLARAQEAEPERGALRASVVYLRTVALKSELSVPGDAVAIRFTHLSGSPPRAEWKAALEREANLRVVETRSECENAAETWTAVIARGACYLRFGGRLYLEAQSPQIAGDTAKTSVYVVYRNPGPKPPPSRVPFLVERSELMLVQSAGRWRVVSDRVSLLTPFQY